jgi:hypothetical protein
LFRSEGDSAAMGDCDEPFDFEVKSGRSGGLRIEITPGNLAPEFTQCINVDERPFWVIEAHLNERLGILSEFDHHGENILEINTWVYLLNDIQKYLEIATGARYLKEAWFEDGYFELSSEICIRPDETFSGIKRFIERLKDQAIAWENLYKNVFIFGF